MKGLKSWDQPSSVKLLMQILVTVLMLSLATNGEVHVLYAQTDARLPSSAAASTPVASLSDALDTRTWSHVERSIEKALKWLAAGQNRNGSFAGVGMGQPGVTSLAVLAYLSKGHVPGVGEYGKELDRAIEFVIGCQRSDGLFTFLDPGPVHRHKHPSKTAMYNHAIAGLLLTEAYGMTNGETEQKIRMVVPKALSFTRRTQLRPKQHSQEKGGWRYLYERGSTIGFVCHGMAADVSTFC